VKVSRSVGFAELAHLGPQRAVVDDAFLAQEVFFQLAQEMRVVAVATIEPANRRRLSFLRQVPKMRVPSNSRRAPKSSAAPIYLTALTRGVSGSSALGSNGTENSHEASGGGLPLSSRRGF
jgi:hypothetical protein